jgi:hypothetical protein
VGNSVFSVGQHVFRHWNHERSLSDFSTNVAVARAAPSWRNIK